MAYCKVWFGVVAEDQNRQIQPTGDLLVPVSVTVDGLVCRKEFSIAASTTVEIFNVDNDLADFDLIVVKADIAGCYLEWTVDKNNGVGDEYATIGLGAKLPQFLTSDDAYANYTANFGGGTADKIERLRVRNTSTDTAKVSMFAVT